MRPSDDLGDPAEPDSLSPRSSSDRGVRQRGSEHWVLLVLSLGSVLGLVFIGLFFEPDARGWGTHEQLGLKPCLPMVEWNFPCPGCGVTTSVTRATQGDLLGSLRAQPLGLLLSIAAILSAIWTLQMHMRGRDAWAYLQTYDLFRWGTVTLGVMTLAWIYKIGAVRGWF